MIESVECRQEYAMLKSQIILDEDELFMFLFKSEQYHE
jgi:hypothetical protein